MTEQSTIYQTTIKPLRAEIIKKVRGIVNVFHDANDTPYGHLLTYTQLLIVWVIIKRLFPRIILILPTQYGKSLAVALAVLLRASTHNEKWAIIAPTEDKARIIMDYIIEHIFDDPLFIERLEYSGTKEKLKQEHSKERITFRGAGEVRIYTANANNMQQVKKALMGFGAPNIVLDESGLIPDELYSTVKRMLGGSEGTVGGTFLLEIGNPFFRNHFWRTWLSKRYIKIFVDWVQALKEGRYTEDYIEEMKDEAFFDVLYECHFPDQEQDVPAGYRALLSASQVENALINQDLPLGHDDNGDLIDEPVLGIDPNHGGKNNTVFVIRYPLTGFAKVVLKKNYNEFRGQDITSLQLADAERIIREYGIGDYRIGVDGGNGGALADALIRKGYLIKVVMFGEAAEDSTRYANAKAEIFWRLRLWIVRDNGKLVKPDNDDKGNGFLELKVINYKETSTSKLQMEPKEKLIERNIQSPDTADALALTFITTRDIVDEDEPDII